jgi:hypothetical protein
MSLDLFTRRIFRGIAIVSLLLAVISAWELQAAGLSAVGSKTVWAMGLGAVFAGLLGWVFSPAAGRKFLLPLFALACMEVMLQVLAWSGVLPAVNTKEAVPWGRVYWTAEGRGNSIRNRHAWHFPSFDLSTTNRVAVIGDSFVEAVEVARDRNLGAVLRKRMTEAGERRTAMSFAIHGSSPAYYLELLKYARRWFQVNEAVIVVYLGNDLTDCSPKLQFHDPAQYLCYALDANGRPALGPRDELLRDRIAGELDARHASPLRSLPRILASHCMIVQLPLSVVRTRTLRRRVSQDPARHPGVEVQMAGLGLRTAPFAVSSSPEAREGAAIMHGLLGLSRDYARTNGIRLHIVSVPFFPSDFYNQGGTDWSARLGENDFLGPDRELAAWCAREGVPFLSLADAMRAHRMTPAEIRALYLSNGCGHFSDAGHRFAAESMHGAFFANRALP